MHRHFSWRSDGPPAPAARRLCGALAALLAVGCGEPDESLYNIEIIGPKDAFVGATSVSLLLRDREVATAPVTASGGFALEVSGVDPAVDRTAIFTVRAVDATNRLVAFGQTPVVEVLPQGHLLRVFVQPPGTLARAPAETAKMYQHVAVAVETQPRDTLTQTMTAPLFGLGLTETMALSSTLYIYNPVRHQVEEAGRIDVARTESTAFARAASGEVFLFGGFSLPNVAEPLKTNAQLEVLYVGRQTFSNFSIPLKLKVEGSPATARARAVPVVAGGKRLLVGGIDDARGPLTTVAALDESTSGNIAIAPYAPMAAARVGHTASADPSQVVDPITEATDTAGRVLVYGGAVAGQPVAEILVARTGVWTTVPPIAAPAGTARRDHQALVLPPPRAEVKVLQVLILGGDEAGVARADSVVCVPSEMRCEPGPVTLRTARTKFTAFLLGNDLVVSGGLGPDGTPVATAEIYDVTTLAFIAEVPALARHSATATTLPNASVVILGGEGVAGPATGIEIYQPRRTL